MVNIFKTDPNGRFIADDLVRKFPERNISLGDEFLFMTTTILAGKILRTGVLESPGLKILNDWQGTTRFLLLMDDVDIQNAATHVEFDVYWSENNVDWKYLAGFKADGFGYVPSRTIIPDFLIWGIDLKNKYVEFKLSLNREMQMGVQIIY